MTTSFHLSKFVVIAWGFPLRVIPNLFATSVCCLSRGYLPGKIPALFAISFLFLFFFIKIIFSYFTSKFIVSADK